ncbi:unnamed protein product (macronuclear) [Paramecium tetraurelia]|uniref:TNFR-Cys domain-containing protein n=1 Tax=Paramecium tetraurelia TaxID=5888 RepID=A0DLM5_PARTE|nr:uncharacterized protein GSPATT00039574001 [Paramecium tetraurelia]CAK83942.1 unnamed protein product [Paramecium tetraurelia]|eukprot:XP_001451339.1 hypothetical protein (macronuclear) [Paramecium tetraurelia strain d4-2]
MTQNFVILISNDKQVEIDQTFINCQSQTIAIFDFGFSQTANKLDFNYPDGITQNTCNQNKVTEIKIVNNTIYTLSISQTGGQLISLDSFGIVQQAYAIDIPNIEKVKFEINKETIIFIYKTYDAQNWSLRICNKILIIIFIKIDFIPGNSDVQLAIVANNLFIQWTQNDNLKSSSFQFIDLQGNELSTGVISSDAQISSTQIVVLMKGYVGFTWTVQNENGQWEISYAVMNQSGQFVDQMEIQCSENCKECLTERYCTQCQPRYIIQEISQNENYCLKQCDPNCKSCDDNKNCQLCKDTYYLENDSCILDEVQVKAIRINQEVSLGLKNQEGVKFSDGSIIMFWSSYLQDSNGWGVFGQLIDKTGVKIGNNIQINAKSQGQCHSPKVALLQDDTVVIIYVDGDPQISEAIIMAQKFDKQLQRIGDEFQVGTFQYFSFNLRGDTQWSIVSLKNGGFVIEYLSQNTYYHYTVCLNFYDSLSNLVAKQQIVGQSEILLYSPLLAATDTTVAYLCNQLFMGFTVYLYSLDGSLLQQKQLNIFNQFRLARVFFEHTNDFYAVGYIKQQEKYCVQVQFFNKQFVEFGDPITIKQLDSYSEIQMYLCDEGLLFLLHLRVKQQDVQELYLLKDKQYSLINTFHIDASYFPTINEYKNFKIIPSLNQQYFILWVKENRFSVQDKYHLYLQFLSYDQQIIVKDQIICQLNCQTCQDPTICDQCLENYYQNENRCDAVCEIGCAYCNFPHYCTLCQEGYYLNEEGKCSKLPIYQPQVLIEYEGGEVFAKVQTLNEGLKAYFSCFLSYVNVKIMDGQQIVNSFSINVQNPAYYTQRTMFYEDENIIFVFYLQNGEIQVQRFDVNSNLLSQVILDISQFSGIQISNYAIFLEPIQGFQYILTFYEQKVIENSIYNFNYINFYYAKLDLGLQKVEDIQKIFTLEQQIGIGLIRGFDYITLFDQYGQRYKIQKDKIEEKFCDNARLYDGGSCSLPSTETWNVIKLFEAFGFNQLIDGDNNIQIQYKIEDASGQTQFKNTNVLNKSMNRQNIVKVFKYINSFVVFIQVENLDQQYEQRYLIAQFIYNTGRKIGDQIYICSMPQNVLEVIQYQNGFKILMQKDECNDVTCSCRLLQTIFDRENDLPDPDQPQQITKDPIKDGKGIEIVDKCIQEPIKDLMKYSNNDYAILYICQNVLRIRKFNSSGEEIKFVEITIENIHLFDATIVNDLIYMIIVYDSDKKISKVYKLDEITNQLIPQLDQSCELDTQDIKN